MSAMSDLICLEYSLSNGNCQNFSPASFPHNDFVDKFLIRPKHSGINVAQSNRYWPVRVAMSMILVAPSFFA